MVVSLTVVRRAMLAWRQDIGAVRADISLLKGRIGEGFVEAILRRAWYFVARVGRETQMPRLMKSGNRHLSARPPGLEAGEQGSIPRPQRRHDRRQPTRRQLGVLRSSSTAGGRPSAARARRPSSSGTR